MSTFEPITRSSLIKSVPTSTKQQVINISLAALPLLLLLLATCSQALELGSAQPKSPSSEQQQQQQHDAADKEASRRSPTLEAELESIVQQRDSFDPTDRSLAEAIISRLMEDNVQNELLSPSAEFVAPAGGGEELARAEQQDSYGGEHQARTFSGPEALRLKKLLSMFEAYESLLNSADGRSIGSSMGLALPMLPASQAATTKRATKQAGSYLAQQHHQATRSNPTTGYGRSSFDFGLGKRPDTSGGVSSNILRFGDSLGGGGGGSVQGVNQFGKRPSAHRYDFGLGKRKASSAYPRYDFGLGKRAPNGIRYDFGLGKK